MPQEPKSAWDKADILLKPLGGLFTAVAVVWLGHIGTSTIEKRHMEEANMRERRQMEEANMQLYAQLMSSREKADSELRQGMFQTIIEHFLAVPSVAEETPAIAAYERDVLRLEILAYNFHDALDLAPLFKDVHRKLNSRGEGGGEKADADVAEKDSLLDRLEKVASEVTDKQIAALEDSGAVVRKTIVLDQFEEEGMLPNFLHQTLYLHTIVEDENEGGANKTAAVGKRFSVDIVDVNREKKEIEVRLAAWPLEEASAPIVDITFNVGFFDFPMIDNTRLQSNERCSVVLTSFGEFSAGIALVYFPGSRASLKEKPFYDEIRSQLVDEEG